MRANPAHLTAGAAALVAVALLWQAHSGERRELGSKIRLKAAEYAETRGLMSKESEISMAYARLESSGRAKSMADWVKVLTDLSGQSGIALESILPGQGMQLNLHFKSDAAGFAGFLHRVAESDPWCEIRSIKVAAAGEGRLECRVALARAVNP